MGRYELTLRSRRAELELLRRSLSECTAGTGGVVVLSGPVGVGKTSLLRAFTQEVAKSDARLLATGAFRGMRTVPWGVMREICTTLDLPADKMKRIGGLLADAALSAVLHDWENEASEDTVASALHDITSIFIEAAQQTPLVIGVDDIHFVDWASLQCLRYLACRISDAPILVVASESSSFESHPPFVDLGYQPHCRSVRLDLLTLDDVAAELALHRDLPAACDPLALHQITGGNARLLVALIEEHRLAPTEAQVPAVGGSFSQAMLTCLLRSDPALLAVARAIAVLNQPATPALLSELLDQSSAAAEWALTAATQAGLLDGGRFRHPAVRTAVLDSTPTQELTELHVRVADHLYRTDARPIAIARHKIAARYSDAPWSAAVLRDAAEAALDVDDTGLALQCLRLAERGSTGPAERASLRFATAQAKWRLDPSAAERDVEELLVAFRAGYLGAQPAMVMADQLAWCGRPAQAGDLVRRISSSGVVGGDDDTTAAWCGTATRLALTYPGWFGPSLGEHVGTRLPHPVTSAGRLQVSAVKLVNALLADGLKDGVADEVEPILRQSWLNERTYRPILSSLEAMVFGDYLQPAASLCDEFLWQVAQRQAPTWSAHLHSVRAMISLRQGNLFDAERHGRRALAEIPTKGLGVFIGVPLSTLVLVAIRRGDYESALNHLAVRVPDMMFETPAGLLYLRARGRYHLARSCYRAAIQDFGTCRDLMLAWGLDLPGIAPWRSDLATANLGIGAPATDLVHAELAMLGTRNTRTRGISLRVLAAATPLEKRLPILREAVEVLQDSGDQLELAEALTDLSGVEHALGEHARARVTSRRARRLSARLNPVGPHGMAPAPVEQPAPAAPTATATGRTLLELSDAERRVASLAAEGNTNREIADRLHITVSTVEQHLTRVYRKLNINRRSDLPSMLQRPVARGKPIGRRELCRPHLTEVRDGTDGPCGLP